MRGKKKKAQSILEYVIVLSAIIVAVIAAAKGPITNAVNQMFADSESTIVRETGQFQQRVGQ